jgi:hypothetical protein
MSAISFRMVRVLRPSCHWCGHDGLRLREDRNVWDHRHHWHQDGHLHNKGLSNAQQRACFCIPKERKLLYIDKVVVLAVYVGVYIFHNIPQIYDIIWIWSVKTGNPFNWCVIIILFPNSTIFYGYLGTYSIFRPTASNWERLGVRAKLHPFEYS